MVPVDTKVCTFSVLGYYECMQVLVQEKIPSSIEFTVAAPTPLAASILDLIRKPLDAVAANPNNLDFRCIFNSLTPERWDCYL